MSFRADNLIKNSMTKGVIIYVMYVLNVCMYVCMYLVYVCMYSMYVCT